MPHIAVFDSGLGGLSVLAALRALVPDRGQLSCSYCADTGCFPYGRLSEQQVTDRVRQVISALLAADGPAVDCHPAAGQLPGRVSGRDIPGVVVPDAVVPDAVVIACNTASTAALAALRHDHPTIPFIGVVPAIKPAAALSHSKVIGLLATPATVQRSYTSRLISDFAADCTVIRHGAPTLAALAEAVLRGEVVADDDLFREIEPLFCNRSMDTVVLGCTHYPLLADRLATVAPWPVRWVDSGAAVARQTLRVLSARAASTSRRSHGSGCAWVTAQNAGVIQALKRAGLSTIGLLRPL